jgi:hypothetical protein
MGTNLLALYARTLLVSAAKFGEVQNATATINVMTFRIFLNATRMTLGQEKLAA